MQLDDHAALTLKEIGVAGKDIHEWIDGLFDRDAFERARFTGIMGFNPYSHRRIRHCREAELDCLNEFRGKYPEETIKAIFQTHVKHDYDGIIPSRKDFDDHEFLEKHHRK